MTWILSPLTCVAAFFVAAALSALLTQLAILGGPVDQPRERGAHKAPTPTSGGLAVMAAAGLSLGLCAALLAPGPLKSGLWLFAFAALVGLSGAVDDIFDLPAKARLLFQIALCVAFASLYPVHVLNFGPGMVVHLPLPVAIAGSAAWLVLGLNAINFMDGSNGLAIGTQILCLLAYAAFVLGFGPHVASGPVLGGLLLVCLASAGAFSGLLPFNLPLNRVFQGDAGSLFGGALVTGGALTLRDHGIASVWLGGFLLAPLLVDVILTLILRARQKQNLLQAHKDHLYQQWLIHKNPSHARMAMTVWGLSALSCAFGVGARFLGNAIGMDLRFAALCLVIAAYCAGWYRLRARLTA
ncbi:MAG: glycosyl transferase family 4 family protein [Asticcacaulis sp.]